MRRDYRAILLGMGIGDGYIQKVNKHRKDKHGNILATYECYYLVVNHSIKQKEYASYKADLLLSVFGGKKVALTPVTQVLKVNGKSYQLVRFSKGHKYFKVIRRLLYSDNGRKKITRRVLNGLNEQALAIWYMDDGHLKTVHRTAGKISSISLTIATYCSKEDAEVICDYFQTTWGVTFRPAYDSTKGKYYIRANTANAKLFVKIVEPYVISSMRYKVDAALHCSETRARDNSSTRVDDIV
jgi:hypothetical protein